MSALTLHQLMQQLANFPRLRDATLAVGFTGPCTVHKDKVFILLGHTVPGRRVSDVVRGLAFEDPKLLVYAHYAGHEVFQEGSEMDAERLDILLSDLVPGYRLFTDKETQARAEEVGLFCKEVESGRVSVYSDAGEHYFTLRADATVLDYDDIRNAVAGARADGYVAGRNAMRTALWAVLGDRP